MFHLRKMGFLKMENGYFKTITAPLRADAVSKYVTWSPGGIDFSYNSPGIAFVLQRTSKNRYLIRAIYGGKYEEYKKESQRTAVEFALKLVDLDQRGAFAARKST